MEHVCESVSVKFYGYGFDVCQQESGQAPDSTGIVPFSFVAHIKAVTLDFDWDALTHMLHTHYSNDISNYFASYVTYNSNYIPSLFYEDTTQLLSLCLTG